MSNKPESLVIVKNPERLYAAIQAFQEEAQSIELQLLCGDEARGPLKVEFDTAQAETLDYLQRTLATVDRVYERVTRNEERLNLILSALESLASLLIGDAEEDQAECACSSCGCGGWGDFVYENADKEDGVATGLADDACDCDLCGEVPFN